MKAVSVFKERVNDFVRKVFADIINPRWLLWNMLEYLWGWIFFLKSFSVCVGVSFQMAYNTLKSLFFSWNSSRRGKVSPHPFLRGQREREMKRNHQSILGLISCCMCMVPLQFLLCPSFPTEMHLFLLGCELPSWRCTLGMHMPVWELSPCLSVAGARSSGTVWTWLAWHTSFHRHKSHLKHRHYKQERSTWDNFPGATGKLNSDKHVFKCIKGTSLAYYYYFPFWSSTQRRSQHGLGSICVLRKLCMGHLYVCSLLMSWFP